MNRKNRETDQPHHTTNHNTHTQAQTTTQMTAETQKKKQLVPADIGCWMYSGYVTMRQDRKGEERLRKTEREMDETVVAVVACLEVEDEFDTIVCDDDK